MEHRTCAFGDDHADTNGSQKLRMVTAIMPDARPAFFQYKRLDEGVKSRKACEQAVTASVGCRKLFFFLQNTTCACIRVGYYCPVKATQGDESVHLCVDEQMSGSLIQEAHWGNNNGTLEDVPAGSMI